MTGCWLSVKKPRKKNGSPPSSLLFSENTAKIGSKYSVVNPVLKQAIWVGLPPWLASSP